MIKKTKTKSEVGGRGGSPYIRRPLRSGVLNPKLNALRQHNPSSFSSPAHRLSRRPLPNQATFFNLSAKVTDIWDLWPTFCRTKNSSKTISFQNHTKSQKNATMGAQGLDFCPLLAPFDNHFSSNFVTHPNLLNCNKHGAKASLLPLRASRCRIEFLS